MSEEDVVVVSVDGGRVVVSGVVVSVVEVAVVSGVLETELPTFPTSVVDVAVDVSVGVIGGSIVVVVVAVEFKLVEVVV